MNHIRNTRLIWEFVFFWITLIWTSSMNAQGFCQRLGGGNVDRARRIVTTPTGELYIVGTTESFGAGSQDIYVIKMKSDGSIVWTRTIGGPYIDTGNDIAIDANGNIYVIGTTVSYGAGIFDLYLIKLNPNGDTLWTRTIGGSSDDYGFGIAIDNNGNIYAVGYTINFGAGSQDVYLAKLNSSGALLWTKTIGGSYGDYGYDVTTDDAGNVYIVGSTGSINAGNPEVYVIKWNSNGVRQWTLSIGGSYNDEGFGITTDLAGNLYVVGYSSSYGAGGEDLYLLKISSSGSLVWSKTIGGFSNDRGYDVLTDQSGNVYIVGYSQSYGMGSKDVYIVKFNSNGDTLWTRTIGDSNNEIGYGISRDGNGNLYVVGETQSFEAGSTDLFLLALDPDGNICQTCNPLSGGLINVGGITGIGGTESNGGSVGSGGQLGNGGTPSIICNASSPIDASLLHQNLVKITELDTRSYLLSSPYPIEKIEIWDIVGRLIYTHPTHYEKNLILTLPHMTKGLYFLHLRVAGEEQIIRFQIH